MTVATARHILVSSEDKCNELKAQIEGGADFAVLAKQHSSCPSGQNGGDLGEFGREYGAGPCADPVWLSSA